MDDLSGRFERTIASLRLRIDELSSLRARVGLPPQRDITRRQWSVLELQLAAVEQRLTTRLRRATAGYQGSGRDVRDARRLNAALGGIELALSRTFAFFDTYMDVLTQWHTPGLGSVLKGCDVLAWAAMRRDHPALRLIEPPLVFCDRGFGASIIRESVSMPDGTPNPMPLIQIPYSRLREKPNLTSILHEAGHQALAHLGLTRVLPRVLSGALSRAGASRTLADLFGLWSSEIGPDFWTFCGAGLAAAGGIKEVLALPPDHVFKVSWTDPHPPPYLRVLLAFECCRRQWGRGPWDRWQREWMELYPVDSAPPEARTILNEGLRFLPLLSSALLFTRFRTLNGRRISDLWDLRSLAPDALNRIVESARSGCLSLTGLSPCGHLAVFRVLKQRDALSEEALDALMSRWLIRLGERRPN